LEKEKKISSTKEQSREYKITNLEINKIIKDNFSDHSLIVDFIDNYHWEGVMPEKVIYRYSDYMEECGEY
jgi:hypothetical protein